MSRATRRHLAERFSEGARQIWLRLAKRDLSDEDFTREAGWSRGVLSKLKFGERLPSRRQSNDLHRILGIDSNDFDRAPRRPFVPPAARQPKAA